MTTYEWITTFLVPVTGIVSWLAGARMRRNENLKTLQTTIDMLVEKNKELYDEIMRLRKENDNLRDDAVKRDNRINELEMQIEKLNKQ
jgi:predicted  nucleic acid-binding Zn-ribbon protein